ncbi:MAG TPA: aldo/keto reductase [Candidatus Acidoferrum sp.]|jgi:aryl-alcohol dehydrogenase-like predicted oxidoreductase|nr:aldo/keto reductase [Candidatus Acidoferrum sp.]
MDRRPLGESGLEVPVVGMGTWRTFDTSEDRGALVETAISAGFTLFDSSPMYGRAEVVLGAALGGRRDQVQVATKIWTESPEEGRRQAENALLLFGHVDIYQVHNLLNWKAQLNLLEELRKGGQVTAVGATHYQASAFPELMEVMRTGRLAMIQIPYNPLAQQATKSVLPLAQELGLGVLVLSPLQGGIMQARPRPDELRSLGVKTWPQAVLKWIASDPRVSCVLTATHLKSHTEENAEAGAPPWFDPDQRSLVEKIARGR